MGDWITRGLRHRRNETGSVLLTVAVLLMVVMGLMAIGVEAGRWYLVRAEVSKSVDAGALAGAKHISNPHVDPNVLAREFVFENLPPAAHGSPSAPGPSASPRIQMLGGGRVQVDGSRTAQSIFARLFGTDDFTVHASGTAQLSRVEIMMLLDRSGSMAGLPFAELQNAAKSFLDFFADTQDQDKIGLISFSTNALVEHAMSTNFVEPMKTAIDDMMAGGYTNPEDAIDQANGPSGLTDQGGIPPVERVPQFVVFFSDGRPNSFRATFTHQNVTYDAVANVNGNCDPDDENVTNLWLWRPDSQELLGVLARPTGDGLDPSSCGIPTTKWNILESIPVPGYAADACDIPDPDLGDYVCGLAPWLAAQHAMELKDIGVLIYAIGLGSRINESFLEQVATSAEQVYVAPTPAELEAIFQRVAQDIRLRLVL